MSGLVQGRKAKHRLSHISCMHTAAVAILDMLGLWTEDSAALLTSMRSLALARCA